jgi:hypothetical protein
MESISDKNIKINEYVNKIQELEAKITVNKESIYQYLKYIYSK